MRESPLARILFAVFAVLTVYASLYPMEGWRGTGVSPLAYLTAPWPRHITSFDIVVNVLSYIPFGFLAAAALQPRVHGGRAFIVAPCSARRRRCAMRRGCSRKERSRSGGGALFCRAGRSTSASR